MTKIAFAVATRFGGAPLRACLEAAWAEAARAGERAEAVVVADGAPAEALEGIEAAFPGVRLVRRDRPLGVGPSYNEAFRVARAPLVSLLNDDMTVEPGYLPAVLAAIGRPAVFAVTPLVLEAGTGEVYCGRTAIRAAGGRPEAIHHRDDAAGPALYATGGGLFRREAYLALGGFDPIYAPFYWEDTDVSYRAWAMGMEVVFAPAARVVHRHRSTVGRVVSDRRREAIEERNRWLFAWSNLTSPAWGRRLAAGSLAAAWRARVDGAPAAVAGFCLAHARLGAALARRRRLAADRRVCDETIWDRVGVP